MKKQRWLIVVVVALMVTGLAYYLDHELSTLEKNMSEMEEAIETNTLAIYQSVEAMDERLTPDMKAMQGEINGLNESVEMMRQDMNKLVSSLDKIVKITEGAVGVFTDLAHNPLVRLLCST